MTGLQVPRQLLRPLASFVYHMMFLLPWVSPMFGQSQVPAAVPNWVRFSGSVKDAQGSTHSGIVGITFALYKQEQGGSPLWLETQNVTVDQTGLYTVYLGESKSGGLPQDLFVSGEARWLGVQPEGQAEQPRILLLSVPYALKAGDAATLGGLPPWAFVLASPANNTQAAASANSNPSGNVSSNLGGSGTQDFIPLWTDGIGDLGNSVLFQSGSGSGAQVGVNTSTPAGTLDVNGNVIARGSVQLPATGTANAAAGFNSQPLALQGSAFNSSTAKAIGPLFQWQTEPIGNNSSTPSGTLNLLYGNGSGSPAETGLNVASNGRITFAAGQTFPGTGTITGITAGTGLTGGGTSGNVTLSINVAFANQNYAQLKAANTFTASQTVNANLSAKQVISTAAQGTAPLQVTSTTQVPNLNASLLGGLSASAFQQAGSYATLGSNSFNGDQNVTGNVSASGVVSGSSYQIGTNTFAFGSFANSNAFLGFAGNSSTTGNGNTGVGVGAFSFNSTGANNAAIGVNALVNNTTGSANTASGGGGLFLNTTGNNNTASGNLALSNNTTGSNNTALGYNAGPDSGHANLSNSTAIGSLAQVTASNALVLGSINGVNGATADTSVGIGTTAPAAKLDVHGNANFTGLITFAAGQTFPGTGTITGVTAGTDLTGGGSSGGVTLSVDTTKVVTGIIAGTDLTGGGTGGVQTLNLDTTKVPTLNAANTFNNNQTIFGNLTVSGGVNPGSYLMGGNLFAFGSQPNANAFQGFAGNFLVSGIGDTGTGVSALGSISDGVANTADGFQALLLNTHGSNNTATGTSAMSQNSAGSHNTADGVGALGGNSSGNYNTGVGESALATNATGSLNTAVGYLAGPQNTGFTNSTAIGANASVQESNAMVLGSINGINGATADTVVGIGTAVPATTLDVEATAPALVGPILLLKNKAPVQSGTFGNSVDFRFALDGGSTAGNPNAYIRAAEDGNNQYGAWISFATMSDGGAGSGAIERMRIRSDGFVGIGTTAPDALLSVNGGADKVGGGSWATFSDRRLKDLDGDFTAGLDAILRLHPIRYHYKGGNALGIQDRDQHIGFVAQDVRKVIPEAVTENARGYLLVNNDPILWTMLNAIKEQQGLIGKQHQQIRAQQAKIKEQEARFDEQQKQINSQTRLSKLQQSQIAQLMSQVGAIEAGLKNIAPHRSEVRTVKTQSVRQ